MDRYRVNYSKEGFRSPYIYVETTSKEAAIRRVMEQKGLVDPDYIYAHRIPFPTLKDLTENLDVIRTSYGIYALLALDDYNLENEIGEEALEALEESKRLRLDYYLSVPLSTGDSAWLEFGILYFDDEPVSLVTEEAVGLGLDTRTISEAAEQRAVRGVRSFISCVDEGERSTFGEETAFCALHNLSISSLLLLQELLSGIRHMYDIPPDQRSRMFLVSGKSHGVEVSKQQEEELSAVVASSDLYTLCEVPADWNVTRCFLSS